MTSSRKVLIAALIVIAFPLLALAVLPLLLNGNSFRPALQAQLEQRLRRPVTLGDIQLKTFPLALRISDLVIGEPAGIDAKLPFVAAKEVSVAVGLWPLLRKEVVIHAIRLKSPRIELVRGRSGSWNYETGTQTGDQTSHSTMIALDRLIIEDGQVAVQDEKAGKPRDVYEHIDLDLKGFGPNRRGSVTGNVRLDTMAAVLKVRSDFETGPAVSAKGNLTLSSDRSKDPLNVTYNLRRPSATGPLSIQQLEARMGSLSASASGSVDMQSTPPPLHIQAKIATAPIADLMRLASLYGAHVPADLNVTGNLQGDVQITGTTEKPIVAGKIEATKAQITAKEFPEPVRASELVVNFTPESATTKPFTIETGSTKVTAQAAVSGYASDAPQWNATIQARQARLEELLRMAQAYGAKPVGLNGTGAIDLDMKVSQPGKAVSYSGTGALQNVSLTSPDLPKALSVATAAVNFSDDRILIDNLQAAMGAMHCNGSLSLKDLARPDVQFNAHIDQVNIDELSRMAAPSGKADKGAAKQARGGSLNRITAKGAIAIDKFIYEQTALTNVKAAVDLTNGILRLSPVTADIFGGKEEGSITADLRDVSPAFAVKVKLTNVDSNQLLSATTSVKNIVTGPLSGNFDLHFLSKPNQNIAATLNGVTQMQMGPGRIGGVQILNEMASIGRFMGYTRKQEAYTNINKVSGSLNIQNGVASTNDLLVDLGGGTLAGAGTMGLVDQSLNLKATATLTKEYAQKNGFGQVGGLLSTVLANQRGDLVVPAIVTGTFSQPRFAPDAAQMAKLKVSGLFGAGGGGVKGLIDSVTGKSANSNPAAGTDVQGATPQGAVNDLLNRFRKKKDQNKD